MDLNQFGVDDVQQELARDFIAKGYRLVKYGFVVTMPTTPTTVKFPTLEILRDKHIRYLQTFNIDYVAATPGPKNNIPLANYETAFITLKNNENMALFGGDMPIPIICFDAQQVNLQGLFYTGDTILSWDNSVITFVTGAGVTAGEAIPFVAHYWNKCKDL